VNGACDLINFVGPSGVQKKARKMGVADEGTPGVVGICGSCSSGCLGECCVSCSGETFF
jgi:hypothetical protein